jgi:ATP-dependent RNA helicase DHX37/DHR1
VLYKHCTAHPVFIIFSIMEPTMLSQSQPPDEPITSEVISDNIVDADESAVVDHTSIPHKATVLPLFATLSAEQQRRVFEPTPHDVRLIVVATNVAETSITIPGIKYVVDCGRHKEKTIQTTSGISKYEVQSK